MLACIDVNRSEPPIVRHEKRAVGSA